MQVARTKFIRCSRLEFNLGVDQVSGEHHAVEPGLRVGPGLKYTVVNLRTLTLTPPGRFLGTKLSRGVCVHYQPLCRSWAKS